jgi:hypothetical protein
VEQNGLIKESLPSPGNPDNCIYSNISQWKEIGIELRKHSNKPCIVLCQCQSGGSEKLICVVVGTGGVLFRVLLEWN